jgi:gamma-glutamyl phosphate reductase
VSEEARAKAVAARTEARKLQALPHQVRKDILHAIADALLTRKDEIMAANDKDVEVAEKDGTALRPAQASSANR